MTCIGNTVPSTTSNQTHLCIHCYHCLPWVIRCDGHNTLALSNNLLTAVAYGLLMAKNMHMSYWFGTELKDFLFYGYNIVTTQGLISTLLGLAALAILYEAMKLLRVKLSEYTKESNEIENQVQNTDSSSLISKTSRRSKDILNSPKCYARAKWLLELGHWTIHVVLGYFLMLTVMTFNGYITIALAIGSGIGYFVFGPILVDMNMRKFRKQRKLLQESTQCTDITVTTERRSSTTSEVSQQAEPEVNIQVDVDLHCSN